MKTKIRMLLICIFVLAAISGCSSNKKSDKQKEQAVWSPQEYLNYKDIISMKKVSIDSKEKIGQKSETYRIIYKCDGNKVVGFLSIPKKFLGKKQKYPCIIFNRGGHNDYAKLTPEDVAWFTEWLGMITFATQYRGVDGGTGKDELGGADVHDVIKLIDFAEKSSFVDMNRLYMAGYSRGGMETYEVIKQDKRIKRAVVVSGMADVFINHKYRNVNDMDPAYLDCVGGLPEEMPEEFKKRSATYWADKIKCPVLIIHSKKDKRVFYEEAEKMVDCLKKAGKDYKFVTYEDDVHGFHEEEDQKVILDWISKK